MSDRFTKEAFCPLCRSVRRTRVDGLVALDACPCGGALIVRGEREPMLHPSSLMARFDAIRFDRDNALADLGPEPRWWRPFARRRWWQARRDVLEMALIMTELLAGKVARMRPDVKVQP